MRKKALFSMALAGVVLAMAATVFAGGYQFVKPEQFKQWLETGKKVVIVDIQVPAEFEKKHFPGSIETNAYPVEKEEERQKLESAMKSISSTSDDIVIVCPRGGGGAKRTYDYFRGKAVAESRLFILEKGIEGWPYPQMCQAGR